jgi:hypothetical protein
MSKTDQPSFDKSSIPPPPPQLPQRKTTMHGRRESDFIIMTFELQSVGDEHDTLTIGIDDNRVKSPGTLTIRGRFEAAEIPGHLRWLADSIARHAENNSPAFREHVSCEKWRGGGA